MTLLVLDTLAMLSAYVSYMLLRCIQMQLRVPYYSKALQVPKAVHRARTDNRNHCMYRNCMRRRCSVSIYIAPIWVLATSNTRSWAAGAACGGGPIVV